MTPCIVINFFSEILETVYQNTIRDRAPGRQKLGEVGVRNVLLAFPTDSQNCVSNYTRQRILSSLCRISLFENDVAMKKERNSGAIREEVTGSLSKLCTNRNGMFHVSN